MAGSIVEFHNPWPALPVQEQKNTSMRHGIPQPEQTTPSSPGMNHPQGKWLDPGSERGPLRPWFWWLSVAAALCLIAGVIGFVQLTLRNDRQDQRSAMISDVLWLEQNLRFQFERNEELLGRLAPDLVQRGTPDPAGLARLKQVLGMDTAFSEVLWFDDKGRGLGAMPPREVPRSEEPRSAIASAIQRARAFAKPAYCPLVRDASEMVFCVAVPSFDGTRLQGFVIGIYPVQRVLTSQVPWWFSERYRLTLNDQTGQMVASKSLVTALQADLYYEMPFDPPGNGLMLRVDAYNKGDRTVPLVFVGAVSLIALALMWSMWLLVRHNRRRHLIELALQREYSFRRAMEDSLHTGLRARDLDGKTIYVNRAFCEMVGWEPEELLGKSAPMPYWLPEDYETNNDTHRRVLAGKASHQSIELRFRRKNGEIFDALIYEAPLMDEQGKHIGWMASIVDITERKRAEELARTQQERLQATARLVTTGELASMLAHELNQPLAAISTYASGCINGLQSDMPRGQLAEALQKISHQSQRAGNIIRRIQNFVRRSEPRVDKVDLGAVVREAAGLLESVAKRRKVKTTLELPIGLPAVQGDNTLLEQVVVNLMRNGMDAMQDTSPEKKQLHVRVAVYEQSMEVSVADKGSGISAESAERLFSPFFTTKEEGMGMGLNICRSIIEWHRGRLWFESRPEGGTVFRFTVPREDLA